MNDGEPTQMVLVNVILPHLFQLSPVVKESVTAPDAFGNAVNVAFGVPFPVNVTKLEPCVIVQLLNVPPLGAE